MSQNFESLGLRLQMRKYLNLKINVYYFNLIYMLCISVMINDHKVNVNCFISLNQYTKELKVSANKSLTGKI